MPVKKESVIVTEEERKKVLDYWNSHKNPPCTIGDLVKHLSDGVTSDPRSQPFGYKTRLILKDAQIKAKDTTWEPVEKIILTTEEQEFVRNHIKEHTIYEICKNLWPGKVKALDRYNRTVKAYLESIGEYVVKKDEGTFPDAKYSPPTTLHGILAKVNEFLHLGLSTQNKTAYQTKCLETTLQFLHSPRFLQEINNYDTVEKRIAFESEFIRSVYEKPDMSVDEVNLTINLCNDYIQASDIKKQLEKLNHILDTITEDRDGKITMGITEAIGKVTSAYNECVNRHQKIYALLNKSRAKRNEENQNKIATLTSLFEWAREEENRRIMLQRGELQKKLRENEVDRLMSLEDLILLSLGMSYEQAVN